MRLGVRRMNTAATDSATAASGHGRRPKICFVALHAYAMLSGREDLGHIGGAEVQQAILARELVRRGYPVSFVTLDHGQPDGEVLNGIRVYKAYDVSSGVRVLRFLHPRLTGLWAALRRANADVYYQRMAEATTGIVAAFCGRFRHRFIFAVASEYSCYHHLPWLKTRRERVMYRYGVRRADRVIAQTSVQQRLLRANFGLDSVVIPNCGADPQRTRNKDVSVSQRVLWLGRFSPEKRIELLFDVAERCPDIAFDIIGDGNRVGDGRRDSPYVQQIKRRAADLVNVSLHGYVPHADVAKWYEGAGVLVCTSEAEGFPNTFLEAWSRGVPVVSTVDPDDLIVKHGLGVVAEDAGGLGQGVRQLLQAGEAPRELSDHVRRYFLHHHRAEVVVDRLEQVLTALTGRTVVG